MTSVDPFEYLRHGMRAHLAVTGTVVLPFLIEDVDAEKRRIALVLDAPEARAAGVALEDWRVYVLSLPLDPTADGPSELNIPNELRGSSRDPLRVDLEVMEGTSVIQRRTSYRSLRPGIVATVRVADADVEGEVLDLSVGGMALRTSTEPPQPGTPVHARLSLGGPDAVAVDGRIVAATATGTPATEWRWNIQFEALSREARSALLWHLHGEKT